MPGMEAVADGLHMSSRTLRRLLQAEGTTFQDIGDEIRHDLSKQYLEKFALEPGRDRASGRLYREHEFQAGIQTLARCTTGQLQARAEVISSITVGHAAIHLYNGAIGVT